MKEKVLEFIKEYACNYGIMPTYREIADGVGLSSVSSVGYYMMQLAGEGKIDIKGKRYRVRGIRYVRCVG